MFEKENLLKGRYERCMLKHFVFRGHHWFARQLGNENRSMDAPEPGTRGSDQALDRIAGQLEAIQELRVWRAARAVAMEPHDCPPIPRVLRSLLTPGEKQHVQHCTLCQSAIKNAQDSPVKTGFEHLEARWQAYKQTRSSLEVRV